MIENLIQLVKENAGEAVYNNPAIPAQKKDTVVNTTAESIQDALKDHLGSGGLGALTGLLNGGSSNASSLTNNISGYVIDALVRKAGIDQGTAGKIVSSLLPIIIQKFLSKTKDPNDNSFTIDGVLKNLSGGKQGGIVDSIKDLF